MLNFYCVVSVIAVKITTCHCQMTAIVIQLLNYARLQQQAHFCAVPKAIICIISVSQNPHFEHADDQTTHANRAECRENYFDVSTNETTRRRQMVNRRQLFENFEQVFNQFNQRRDQLRDDATSNVEFSF